MRNAAVCRPSSKGQHRPAPLVFSVPARQKTSPAPQPFAPPRSIACSARPGPQATGLPLPGKHPGQGHFPFPRKPPHQSPRASLAALLRRQAGSAPRQQELPGRKSIASRPAPLLKHPPAYSAGKRWPPLHKRNGRTSSLPAASKPCFRR